MIYVAGPFFTPEERKELEIMISWIKRNYYEEDLFIPMEHFIPNGEQLSNMAWAKKVYQMDVKAIDRCSQMIALYLGHYSDTGTAWEIGYAAAKGIPVLLWIPNPNVDMSIMPINSCARIINARDYQLNQK